FHGELDTRVGVVRQLVSKLGNPSHVSGFIRNFLPDLGASLGARVQYEKYEKLRYSLRGKKSSPSPVMACSPSTSRDTTILSRISRRRSRHQLPNYHGAS
ncbi:Outer envelope pore protein 21B, chloroplastic, partial [Linum perenne]